jgi:hypothetical protein
MTALKAGTLGLMTLFACSAAPAARAMPLDSTVMASTSIVISGSAVQTLDLLQVFMPTGGYWAWLGVDGCGGCGAPPEFGVSPRPISVEHVYESVAGGTIGVVKAEYDPTSFAFGLNDVVVGLRWVHTSAPGVGSYIYPSHVARVMRLLDIPVANLLQPISLRGSFFGFRVPGKPGSVDTVDATITWGDGKQLLTPLPVVDGIVVLSPDLHDYEHQGRYQVTLSYVLGGQSYGLTTEVAVPAPPTLLLLVTGVAALAGLRRRPEGFADPATGTAINLDCGRSPVV